MAKKSKHYTAEDWDAAIDQFVTMSKDYHEMSRYLTPEQQMKFDNARMVFMGAVDANGNEELAIQVKKKYSELVD